MIDTESLIINSVSDPLSKDDNREMLFKQLEAELKNSKVPGVGLAAVQIGILARAAIIRTVQSTLNLWNPEIVSREGEVIFPEGCLSFPGLCRSIRRAKEVTVKNGDGRTYQFDGFDAIVVQHEIDHMDGVTIADKNYAALKIGRNKLCPCGSRKKFKKCHLGKELELQQLLIGKKLKVRVILGIIAAGLLLNLFVQTVYASQGSHNTTTATTGDSTATTGAASANNDISVERGAAYSAPSLGQGEVGTEVVQLHSFLGGVTFANTELDTRVKMKVDVILDAYETGLISKKAATARVYLALEEMNEIQEPRKVPLLGFSCNHRTLFNLAGLLCN